MSFFDARTKRYLVTAFMPVTWLPLGICLGAKLVPPWEAAVASVLFSINSLILIRWAQKP
jgi:hypothetical protein